MSKLKKEEEKIAVSMDNAQKTKNKNKWHGNSIVINYIHRLKQQRDGLIGIRKEKKK